MLFLLGFCVFHLLPGAAYAFIMFFTLGWWLVYKFCFSSATVMYIHTYAFFNTRRLCSIPRYSLTFRGIFVRILAHR